ncbi:MAG: hypothetical protein PHF56_11625 [Desulfuromonadaceae bacterium]|nr:hypothetical protein [Desulfuromonadaceae bacterium]
MSFGPYLFYPYYDQADIDRLRETPISEDQKIIEKKEGWQLQTTIGNSYQLLWWLRGYDGE